ncbi:MAG: hypothetical protein LUF25_05430 [Phascolarctobacterium sp.]|nr:hypothetical protein [Phascolarctobacterium sp.]
MKLLVLLAAVILLLPGTVSAYTDRYAGYSIKEDNSTAAITAENFRGFIDTENNFYAVSSYDAKEVKELIGKNFSTKTFDREYEKLTLMERSEISLKTVPLPLFDINLYTDSLNLIEKPFHEPDMRIDKLGKFKAVTLSYPSQSTSSTIIHTSFLSANDKLYIIYSAGRNDNDIEEKQQENTWERQKKFVNSLKIIRSNSKAPFLTYHDQMTKNTLIFPDDWAYLEINFNGTDGKGTLILSTPLHTLTALTESFDRSYVISSMSVAETVAKTNKVLDKLEQKIIDDTDDDNIEAKRKIIENMDVMLVMSSFITSLAKNNGPFGDLFHDTATNKASLEGLLNECFKRIENTDDDGYFSLKEYMYKIDISDKIASLDVVSDIEFFGNYDFTSVFKLNLDTKNKGNLFWLMRRVDDSKDISWLMKQVNT